MRILITGAAGYIGGMLADQFSRGPEVEEIVGIDLKPMPELLQGNAKISWIQGDLSLDGWQEKLRGKIPDVVIHCAWQIRDFYFRPRLQHRLNVEGSEKLFDFCFAHGVKKLIHFSTVSSYGAFDTNKLGRPFIENDPPRERVYRYGVEKREVEQSLKKKYMAGGKTTQVFIVRPATITGPRERYMMGKKGLAYMLRPNEQIGPEHKKSTGMMDLVRQLLFAMPIASDEWCRQYIHEDDVTDVVGLLTFSKVKDQYEVFNIAPHDIIRAPEMAELFKRKTIRVFPWMVRFAFALAWDLSFGRIPTSPGGWRFYCYPIPVDGSKIEKKYDFSYAYSSRDTLIKDEGRYSYAKDQTVKIKDQN